MQDQLEREEMRQSMKFLFEENRRLMQKLEAQEKQKEADPKFSTPEEDPRKLKQAGDPQKEAEIPPEVRLQTPKRRLRCFPEVRLQTPKEKPEALIRRPETTKEKPEAFPRRLQTPKVKRSCFHGGLEVKNSVILAKKEQDSRSQAVVKALQSDRLASWH